MNDETVVPLRPGFDNEFRGFNRGQVLEHIELLEDQVKILVTDRDEAMRLNEDQRRITDETRRRMEEMSNELKRIESSETGLPHATRRMQNMLTMADQEASSIREHARRDAETIRGTASTDAEQIRTEAATYADSLRQECASLVNDLENRRERLDEEHATRTAHVETQREELRQSSRAAYEEAVAAGQREATDMLRKSTERCEQMESASRHYHSEILTDLKARASELENARTMLMELLDTVSGFAAAHRTELDKQLTPIRSAVEIEQGDPAAAAPPDRSAGVVAQDANPNPRIPVQTGQGNDPGHAAGSDTGGPSEAREPHTSPAQSVGVGASTTVDQRN